jgi:hypothetical protein
VKVQQPDELIQKLPNIDDPDLYSLPWTSKGSPQPKELVEDLKIATFTSDASNKFSREEWNQSLPPEYALWKDLERVVGEVKLKRRAPRSHT